MTAPACDFCQRMMEPTIALAFFYPVLRDKPEAFKWACRHCKVLQTEPEYAPFVTAGEA